MIRVINCFTFFFIVRFIEEFIIVPKSPFSTHSMVACIAGIAVLMIYLKMENKPFEKIGLIFSRHKIKKGFLTAVLLNIVPFAVVYPLTYLYLKNSYAYVRPTLYFDSAKYCYSNGAKAFVLLLLAGLVVSVFHAVFYELTFRGLLMQLCSKTFSFAKTNLIQAALYTFWFLISAARVAALSNGAYTSKDIVVLIGFFIVYEFMIAVKLGLCRHGSGALWVCLFDHMAFSFIGDVVHFQISTAAGQLVSGYSSYGLLIAYQAISFLIALIYYIKKMKTVKNTRREAAVRRHASTKQLP